MRNLCVVLVVLSMFVGCGGSVQVHATSGSAELASCVRGALIAGRGETQEEIRGSASSWLASHGCPAPDDSAQVQVQTQWANDDETEVGLQIQVQVASPSRGQAQGQTVVSLSGHEHAE